jgi:hypothetical protein
MFERDQVVMCGRLEAIVRCAVPDGDGNVVVELQRDTGIFYSKVQPASLSAPGQLVVIDGVEYLVDLVAGTIAPSSGTRP